ncbi:MAG: NifB/NifX family molybdenum-iron cluster-binding protein [Spirochaetia bacterium]
MKAAFSCWNNRIAPVFDTARELVIIEPADGEVSREKVETGSPEPPFIRALELMERGVSELICGAVSREFHQILLAQGIKVIPFITGDLDKVITAWKEGMLSDDVFIMPGCRGGRRMRRGKTQGGRRGSGAGPGGQCVCPSCGRSERHVPGVPCVEKRCSSCGTAMVRE